ncbi:hypothetical protein [Caldanaerobacter sp.]|uniref:hypothetical protein n=1 Tax=Caldanaerobacter sp. TaxID=2930036 RepID=UPI002586A561|nr:hypothetical protein [Caldanaerobacter sp.]
MAKMMVAFLPWCPIDKEYSMDGIKLTPYSRSDLTEEINNLGLKGADKIFDIYRDLKNQPVEKIALVKYQGEIFFNNFEFQLFEISELIELACFTALSKRNFFDGSNYCNRDHFTLYIQKFKIPLEGITFETPLVRGAGNKLSFCNELDKLSITMPEHIGLAGVKTISLAEDLLNGLLNLRKKLINTDSKGWERWQEWISAIECFNWANTDKENLPYAVEWVLMASAFEKILGAKSEAEDVGEKFKEVIKPLKDYPANGFRRKSNKFKGFPLRQEWMREFYRVRGDLAHGYLKPKQPNMAWRENEHLTLARIAFPLVVKVLLDKEGFYQLTLYDKAYISAFEEMADREFLKENNIDEMIEKYFWDVVKKEAYEKIFREESQK